MFHLYTILKAHPAGEIVTQEEMDVAAGCKIFDSVQTADGFLPQKTRVCFS